MHPKIQKICVNDKFGFNDSLQEEILQGFIMPLPKGGPFRICTCFVFSFIESDNLPIIGCMEMAQIKHKHKHGRGHNFCLQKSRMPLARLVYFLV